MMLCICNTGSQWLRQGDRMLKTSFGCIMRPWFKIKKSLQATGKTGHFLYSACHLAMDYGHMPAHFLLWGSKMRLCTNLWLSVGLVPHPLLDQASSFFICSGWLPTSLGSFSVPPMMKHTWGLTCFLLGPPGQQKNTAWSCCFKIWIPALLSIRHMP